MAGSDNINQRLTNAAIRNRRALVNVENYTARTILNRLTKLEKELAGEVVTFLGGSDPDTWLTGARQARVLKAVGDSISEIFPGLERDLERQLLDVAGAEADGLLERYRAATMKLPEAIPIFKVPASFVEEAATNFLPRNPSAGTLPVVERAMPTV